MNHPTTQPDTTSTSSISTAGETVAEVDGAHDVVIVDSDENNDTYTVQLPDGSEVNTTSDGVDQISSIDWEELPRDEYLPPKPWNPDPSCFDFEPDDPIGSLHTPETPVTKSNINYVCPKCGGKFSSWYKDGTGIGGETTCYCPFCMTERGDYGPSNEKDEPVESKIRELVEQSIEEVERTVSKSER